MQSSGPNESAARKTLVWLTPEVQAREMRGVNAKPFRGSYYRRQDSDATTIIQGTKSHTGPTDILYLRQMIQSGFRRVIIFTTGAKVNENDSIAWVVVSDHINLSGQNPLIGENDSRTGPRFPDMTHLYNPELNRQLLSCFEKMGLSVAPGVALIPCPGHPRIEPEWQSRLIAICRCMAPQLMLPAIVARHAGAEVGAVVGFGPAPEKYITSLCELR